MGLYQNIAKSAIIVAIGLSGCAPQRQPQTLEGTVLEEFGTAPIIVESSGSIFGDDTVMFGDPTYGLIIESQGKEYTINVRDGSLKPVIALAKAIEPGDIIRITYDLNTRIYDDGVGTTYGYTIQIIEKVEK